MSDPILHPRNRLGRWAATVRYRHTGASDLGQTAIVAVLAITLIVSIVSVALVQTVISSLPLQQTKAVQLYANRALEAGQNAYLTAINSNSSLAQCSTNTNTEGICAGLNYGEWNLVQNSTIDGDTEYYAFGNPVPDFDPTSHTLISLSVQIVGAARDASAPNGYLFDQNTITVTPKNGFLQNVWWTNYESYSSTGSYTTCNYNYDLGYNINNKNIDCSPVYFGPGDYLFGPVFTNDSVFVSGSGQTTDSPSFGTSTSPSAVTTADPNCLFVDATHGMGGSDSNCADASSDVALYDTTNSSYGSAPEIPPTTDGQLSTVAGLYGCLYSGPTQISLAGNQMTVISPDTPESTVNGTTYDTNNNSSTNTNSCPNNGTATLPSNGVVYVENASAPQPWANPFDDPIANSVTNLTESGTLSSGKSVTLTATVSSDSSQLNSGATVSFGQTTKNGYGNGTSTSTINGCSSQSLSTPTAVVPATTPASYTATATCQFTYSSSNTGAFSATYSGGTYASTSSANLGETYTLTPSFTYGPDAQTSAGGCTSCYYGETSSPDAEGDAFVNGSLSGELTIGTANDVVVDGNITYADCNWTTGQSGEAGSFCPYNNTGANDTLGLIANNYVEVNQPILASTSNSQNPTLLPSCSTPAAICNPSPGTNGLTIDAAILALTESFVVNNYGDGSTQGLLNDYGSIQQYARGPVGTFNETCSGFGNTNCTYAMASGYEKHYTWDPLLDYLSPPSYLAPSTAAWTLESVSNNAGTQATADNVCPPLEPPYGYTQWITAYCSQTIGGLPNYPSATVPTPPTGVTATANADGTVNVTWADPVSSNGSSISNYTVTSNPACSTCGGTSVSGSSATSATITGLSGDQTYTFTVTATNASGASSPSNASNWVQVPGVPNAPTLASAVANANGSVSVNWTDPSNNGSAITGYTVNPSPSCSTCSGTSVSGAAATATTITGLTGGSSYTFTVTATNDVGTSTSSASSNSVTIPSVPGTPTGVTATPGNTQATVTWTAPSNGGSAITAYVITPYLNGTTAQTAQTFTSTNTTQAVTGLTNGNAYTFKVAAINAVGTGNQSSSSNSVTPAHVPGAPTIGTATAGNASATVTWTAPASNGGSAISGYTVTPYIGGVAQTTQTFNSAATTETVTGLTNGTAYTFTVVAINAVGPSAQSGYSNSVTPVTVPGAPTIGTATGGNASAVVTWTDPSSNGGATITSYVVTPYIGGAAQTAQSFSSSATSGTVTGLTNGTTYTFTVAAINSAGESAQSAASNSVTPVTTPGAPTIGTATGGNASATVTWTAPASNGGATITSYVVTPYTSVGNVAQTAQTFNSAATTETVSGLTNGTAYYFKVAAINSVGTGNQSGSSNSVTPMTVPGAPTMGSVTSGNTTVTVNWTAPASNGGSPITSYVVTPYIGGLAQIAQSFSSSATSGMVTGLTNGTSYTFTVAAINSVGESNQSGSSSSVIPATTPGAPTIGTATGGNASASLTWTAPASNGGSAITGYVVTPYLNGTTAQTAQTFNSAAATETVTGLSNSPYTFKVAAINIVGTGPQSAASNSVTPVTVAGAPAIGTATAGNAQATLSWTAPGATGGSPVTGYAVTPYIGGVAQTVQTFNTTATTEVVTGLTNGTAYTFTVAAINAQGTGAQSGASNSVTPATTPGAPTITAATSGNSSVSLTWTTPASNGAAITGYVVTPYIGTTAQTATTFNNPATTETVGGLTNGTAYTFTVAAINSVGTGAPSAPSNSVTPATVPGAPTIGTATGGNASATLTWTAPGSTGGAPITGYVVTPYIGGTAQTAQTFNSTLTTEVATGLTNGTAYTFKVAAINSAGTGAQSGSSNSVTPLTVPGAPTITVATSGNASVNLTWTAPGSNGGATITGYVVTPYIGGTAQAAQTFNSPALTETATGLANGTAYTFTVAAINSQGTGTASAASNPVTPATVAGAPTIGTATPGNASASLTWTAPAITGGAPITGYVVTPYIGGTAQAAQTFNSPATTETVVSLTNGSTYTFKVAAINSAGTGAQSAASNSVTPATTPNAPTIGTATAGIASATVTWTAPGFNGGNPITQYVVTPYIAGVGQTPQTFNSTATTETVTGLTNNTAYTFTVAAINGIGTGASSGASNSITTPTTPGTPTIGTATAGNLQATVTWTAPASNGGTPITGYVVTPYLNGTTPLATQTFNNTATTETVTGLSNGSAYDFTVAAINGVGTGGFSVGSNSVTPATVPGAPTIGTATAGNSQATVTWTAPTVTGGAPVTGYVVTPYIGGTAQATQTFNSTALTEIVTGLTNTAYTFKVAAINSAGTGAQSAASNSATPLTPPGAPTIGTATKASNTSANVSWTAPATNGGSPVTGYIVTPYINGTAQATQTFNTTATTDTVTGLSNFTNYTFKVAAINLEGTGAQSGASNTVNI